MSQKSLITDTIKIIYPKSRKKVVHKQSDTEVVIYLTWYLKPTRYINHILHYHSMSLTGLQGNIPTDT